MMNITPFIHAQNFAVRLPPPCKELDDVRANANKYLAQFRVWTQCAADARGIPAVSAGIKTFCDAAWLALGN
jgi:nitrogen fixation protein NifB